MPKTECHGSAPAPFCFARREPRVMSALPSVIGARISGSSPGRFAVVSIDEHYNVGGIRCGEARQTCAPISTARFAEDACPRRFRNLGRPVSGVAVNHQNIGDDICGEIGENTSDSLRLIVCGDDDGDTHGAWLGQPPRCVRPASSKPFVEAKDSACAPD